MTVGERIKSIRKTLGINQTDFGAKISISRSAIAALECGERNVTDRVITQISKAFHVREEWLRKGEEPKDIPLLSSLIDDEELSDIDRAIIGRYLTLSGEQRQMLKDFIVSLAAEITAIDPLAAERAEKEKQLAEHEQQAAALRAELGIIPTDAPRKHISAERRAELHAELDRQLDEEEEKMALESQASA